MKAVLTGGLLVFFYNIETLVGFAQPAATRIPHPILLVPITLVRPLGHASEAVGYIAVIGWSVWFATLGHKTYMKDGRLVAHWTRSWVGVATYATVALVISCVFFWQRLWPTLA